MRGACEGGGHMEGGHVRGESTSDHQEDQPCKIPFLLDLLCSGQLLFPSQVQFCNQLFAFLR